jgi:hypothetical protein
MVIVELFSQMSRKVLKILSATGSNITRRLTTLGRPISSGKRISKRKFIRMKSSLDRQSHLFFQNVVRAQGMTLLGLKVTFWGRVYTCRLDSRAAECVHYHLPWPLRSQELEQAVLIKEPQEGGGGAVVTLAHWIHREDVLLEALHQVVQQLIDLFYADVHSEQVLFLPETILVEPKTLQIRALPRIGKDRWSPSFVSEAYGYYRNFSQEAVHYRHGVKSPDFSLYSLANSDFPQFSLRLNRHYLVESIHWLYQAKAKSRRGEGGRFVMPEVLFDWMSQLKRSRSEWDLPPKPSIAGLKNESTQFELLLKVDHATREIKVDRIGTEFLRVGVEKSGTKVERGDLVDYERVIQECHELYSKCAWSDLSNHVRSSLDCISFQPIPPTYHAKLLRFLSLAFDHQGQRQEAMRYYLQAKQRDPDLSDL